MIRGKAKFYLRHIFFIALYLLATLSNLIMTGDMDTRKYLPLETESIYELNDNTEIFLPGKLSRMME